MLYSALFAQLWSSSLKTTSQKALPNLLLHRCSWCSSDRTIVLCFGGHLSLRYQWAGFRRCQQSQFLASYSCPPCCVAFVLCLLSPPTSRLLSSIERSLMQVVIVCNLFLRNIERIADRDRRLMCVNTSSEISKVFLNRCRFASFKLTYTNLFQAYGWVEIAFLLDNSSEKTWWASEGFVPQLALASLEACCHPWWRQGWLPWIGIIKPWRFDMGLSAPRFLVNFQLNWEFLSEMNAAMSSD